MMLKYCTLTNLRFIRLRSAKKVQQATKLTGVPQSDEVSLDQAYKQNATISTSNISSNTLGRHSSAWCIAFKSSPESGPFEDVSPIENNFYCKVNSLEGSESNYRLTDTKNTTAMAC